LPLGVETSAKAEAIAHALICNHADEEQLLAANNLAQAQIELLRIRKVRAELMAKADLASGDLEHLRRLAALDHYERLAQTKRRRASHKL
jgi:hypothetical protein